ANRALSLALACNLHIPYTIAVDASGIPASFNDSDGKVVIICSSINSPQTISVINQLKQYSRTKILLVDMVGTIFNTNNVLHRRLAEEDEPFDGRPRHRRNLLVLTILTENFRSFLHRLHGVDLGDYQHISENLLKIRLMEENPIHTSSFGEDDRDDIADDRDDEATMPPMSYEAPSHDSANDDVQNRIQTMQPHRPEVMLELLSLATNGTNASQNCDFHYFFNHVANWYEILSQTFDSARCQTLFASYCEADVGYLHPSSNGENITGTVREVSGSLPRPADPGMNQSLEATIDEIERFCDLFLASYDRLLSDGLLAPANITQSDPFREAARSTDHLLMFGEHFYFFDFLLAVWQDSRKQHQEQHRTFQFDFVAFDFKNISHHRSAVAWRPFLILQQSQLHQHQFRMHPVPPGYADWVVEATLETIWICGMLCWATIGLVALVAVTVIVGSVVFSIAVR
uniref:Uncharacterized protein n=1 Tax=Anopheles dirus TaxID=7168 RepID=A0A182NMQ7_9DIPT